MERITLAHRLNTMSYADDTQLYIVCKTMEKPSAITRVEHCLTDIKVWYTQNMLKCNSSKTDLLHFKSKFRTSTFSASPITLMFDGKQLSQKTKATNLGVILDSQLTMGPHVDMICRSAMRSIRVIGMIRRYLDISLTKRLVNSIITPRLDYCNALLVGLPDKLLNKMQRVQNSAARLITLSNKFFGS